MRSLPSAVSRRRLQSAQNGSETGLTKPISPRPSAKRKTRAVADGSRGSSSSGMDRLDHRAQLLAGEDRVRGPGVVGVERHELDEADLEGGRAGELAEALDLLLGEAAHRHRVHLDRPHLRMGGDRVEARAAPAAARRGG